MREIPYRRRPLIGPRRQREAPARIWEQNLEHQHTQMDFRAVHGGSCRSRRMRCGVRFEFDAIVDRDYGLDFGVNFGDACFADRRHSRILKMRPVQEQVVQLNLVEATRRPSLELDLDLLTHPRHRRLRHRGLLTERLDQRGLHITGRQATHEPGDHQ